MPTPTPTFCLSPRVVQVRKISTELGGHPLPREHWTKSSCTAVLWILGLEARGRAKNGKVKSEEIVSSSFPPLSCHKKVLGRSAWGISPLKGPGKEALNEGTLARTADMDQGIAGQGPESLTPFRNCSPLLWGGLFSPWGLTGKAFVTAYGQPKKKIWASTTKPLITVCQPNTKSWE